MYLAPGLHRHPNLERLRNEIATRWRGFCGPAPFPVFEPHIVDLQGGRPAFLAETHQPSSRTPTILVCAGNPTSQEGPFVAVRSSLFQEDHPATDPQQLLIEERDRLYDHAGIEEDEPATAPVAVQAVLHVNTCRLPVTVHAQAGLWAVIATHETECGMIAATVVGRGVPIDAVRLQTVEDLTDLVESGAEAAADLIEHLTELAGEAQPPEQWDLPAAQGTQAHFALIDHILAEEEAPVGGDLLTGHHRSHRQPTRLREIAIRAQMELADQDRERATQSLSSLTNHVRELESLPWFADQGLRQAAIEEIVRWVTFDADVDSRSAQEAWESWHGLRGVGALHARHQDEDRYAADDTWLLGPIRAGDPSDMQFLRGRAEIEQMNRFEWRAAWQRWVEERANDGA